MYIHNVRDILPLRRLLREAFREVLELKQRVSGLEDAPPPPPPPLPPPSTVRFSGRVVGHSFERTGAELELRLDASLRKNLGETLHVRCASLLRAGEPLRLSRVAYKCRLRAQDLALALVPVGAFPSDAAPQLSPAAQAALPPHGDRLACEAGGDAVASVSWEATRQLSVHAALSPPHASLAQLTYRPRQRVALAVRATRGWGDDTGAPAAAPQCSVMVRASLAAVALRGRLTLAGWADTRGGWSLSASPPPDGASSARGGFVLSRRPGSGAIDGQLFVAVSAADGWSVTPALVWSSDADRSSILSMLCTAVQLRAQIAF